MKTIFKRMLCIVVALGCIPAFGCSKNTDEPADSGSSISDSVSDSEESIGSGDNDIAVTSNVKITTTVAATTTTAKVTTTTTTTSVTTTTTAITTTTAATTTTTKAQTAATTTTTKAQTVATTTTAPKTTFADNVCSTVIMVQDDVTLEYEPITVYYYDEKPENPTLQAYSDFAETSILTDEIRELITADVMNYANTKYGYVKNDELYANSTTDYHGSFHGGEFNTHGMGFYTAACMIAWGAMEEDYILPSLNDNAKSFQAGVYGWVDSTVEMNSWNGYTEEDCVGWGANVGFCYLRTREDGYKVYQVSFIF